MLKSEIFLRKRTYFWRNKGFSRILHYLLHIQNFSSHIHLNMNMGLWKLCEYGVVIHSWFAFTQHITCIRVAPANHLYPKKRHDPTGRGKMSPKYDVIWLRWVLYTSPKSTWAINNLLPTWKWMFHLWKLINYFKTKLN